MGRDDRSPEERPPKPRIGLVLGLVITLSVSGLIWMHSSGAKPAPARSPTSAIPVTTVTVMPQVIDITRTALGTVSAWNTATITPQVSGQIVDLPFKEGSLVHAGDVLVRIDPRSFQAALDQARAKKAQDDANL